MVINQFPDQRNHNDSGGKIIDDRGKKECDKRNYPKQFTLIGLLYFVRDNVKAIMHIDQLNNGHGAE